MRFRNKNFDLIIVYDITFMNKIRDGTNSLILCIIDISKF